MDRNTGFQQQFPDGQEDWLQEDLGPLWDLGRTTASEFAVGCPTEIGPQVDTYLDPWNYREFQSSLLNDLVASPVDPASHELHNSVAQGSFLETQSYSLGPVHAPVPSSLTGHEQPPLFQQGNLAVEVGQPPLGSYPMLPNFNEIGLPQGFSDQPNNSAQEQPPVPQKPFSCAVPGCNSKGFNRRYELERHMKKHTRAQVYPCPVTGCRFQQNRRAFYRQDKLQSHLRAAHPGYQANTAAASTGPAVVPGPAGPSVQ